MHNTVNVSGKVFYFILLAVLLILTYSSLSSFIEGNRFADGELSSWKETTGVIEDIWYTGDSIEPGDGSDWRNYSVRFSYIITYETAGGMVSAQSGTANSGRVSHGGIPGEAYVPPYKAGDYMTIVYDPATPELFRMGTMSEVGARDRSLVPLFVSIGAGIVSVLMLVFGLKSLLRKRALKARAG